ncbi:MAG: hypothetical protein FJX68_08265 [Alphaproteobacteria bacterium]|nr:hypothetical protein [Alphaproteobacteria bacterium]
MDAALARRLLPAVLAQLEALSLDPGRPLIVADADEVLLQFVRGLEAFLADEGLYLELASFALTGNVRHRGSGEALAGTAVKTLIERFFAERMEEMQPVEGAAAALAALSERAQVMVLSNVPLERREARARLLARHGMPYPLVANAGTKGGALAYLAGRVAAPIVFLDDIPHNIAAVALSAEAVIRVHFVADSRLARLLLPAADCHARHDDWPSARNFIEERLAQHGY